ncbi:MAG: thrombospondin type 3 repeat-containing protein, partial [Candidatus Omnitrophica bacterium]|nr:thrombospondin type 3 repeat-containing protein [Candidatus Omnitrophota bacterium]
QPEIFAGVVPDTAVLWQALITRGYVSGGGSIMPAFNACVRPANMTLPGFSTTQRDQVFYILKQFSGLVNFAAKLQLPSGIVKQQEFQGVIAQLALAWNDMIFYGIIDASGNVQSMVDGWTDVSLMPNLPHITATEKPVVFAILKAAVTPNQPNAITPQMFIGTAYGSAFTWNDLLTNGYIDGLGNILPAFDALEDVSQMRGYLLAGDRQSVFQLLKQYRTLTSTGKNQFVKQLRAYIARVEPQYWIPETDNRADPDPSRLPYKYLITAASTLNTAGLTAGPATIPGIAPSFEVSFRLEKTYFFDDSQHYEDGAFLVLNGLEENLTSLESLRWQVGQQINSVEIKNSLDAIEAQVRKIMTGSRSSFRSVNPLDPTAGTWIESQVQASYSTTENNYRQVMAEKNPYGDPLCQEAALWEAQHAARVAIAEDTMAQAKTWNGHMRTIMTTVKDLARTAETIIADMRLDIAASPDTKKLYENAQKVTQKLAECQERIATAYYEYDTNIEETEQLGRSILHSLVQYKKTFAELKEAEARAAYVPCGTVLEYTYRSTVATLPFPYITTPPTVPGTSVLPILRPNVVGDEFIAIPGQIISVSGTQQRLFSGYTAKFRPFYPLAGNPLAATLPQSNTQLRQGVTSVSDSYRKSYSLWAGAYVTNALYGSGVGQSTQEPQFLLFRGWLLRDQNARYLQWQVTRSETIWQNWKHRAETIMIKIKSKEEKIQQLKTKVDVLNSDILAYKKEWYAAKEKADACRKQAAAYPDNMTLARQVYTDTIDLNRIYRKWQLAVHNVNLLTDEITRFTAEIGDRGDPESKPFAMAGATGLWRSYADALIEVEIAARNWHGDETQWKANKLDSDGDGYSDELEEKCGTNPDHVAHPDSRPATPTSVSKDAETEVHTQDEGRHIQYVRDPYGRVVGQVVTRTERDYAGYVCIVGNWTTGQLVRDLNGYKTLLGSYIVKMDLVHEIGLISGATEQVLWDDLREHGFIWEDNGMGYLTEKAVALPIVNIVPGAMNQHQIDTLFDEYADKYLKLSGTYPTHYKGKLYKILTTQAHELVAETGVFHPKRLEDGIVVPFSVGMESEKEFSHAFDRNYTLSVQEAAFLSTYDKWHSKTYTLTRLAKDFQVDIPSVPITIIDGEDYMGDLYIRGMTQDLIQTTINDQLYHVNFDFTPTSNEAVLTRYGTFVISAPPNVMAIIDPTGKNLGTVHVKDNLITYQSLLDGYKAELVDNLVRISYQGQFLFDRLPPDQTVVIEDVGAIRPVTEAEKQANAGNPLWTPGRIPINVGYATVTYVMSTSTSATAVLDVSKTKLKSGYQVATVGGGKVTIERAGEIRVKLPRYTVAVKEKLPQAPSTEPRADLYRTYGYVTLEGNRIVENNLNLSLDNVFSVGFSSYHVKQFDSASGAEDFFDTITFMNDKLLVHTNGQTLPKAYVASDIAYANYDGTNDRPLQADIPYTALAVAAFSTETYHLANDVKKSAQGKYDKQYRDATMAKGAAGRNANTWLAFDAYAGQDVGSNPTDYEGIYMNLKKVVRRGYDSAQRLRTSLIAITNDNDRYAHGATEMSLKRQASENIFNVINMRASAEEAGMKQTDAETALVFKKRAEVFNSLLELVALRLETKYTSLDQKFFMVTLMSEFSKMAEESFDYWRELTNTPHFITTTGQILDPDMVAINKHLTDLMVRFSFLDDDLRKKQAEVIKQKKNYDNLLSQNEVKHDYYTQLADGLDKSLAAQKSRLHDELYVWLKRQVGDDIARDVLDLTDT